MDNTIELELNEIMEIDEKSYNSNNNNNNNAGCLSPVGTIINGFTPQSIAPTAAVTTATVIESDSNNDRRSLFHTGRQLAIKSSTIANNNNNNPSDNSRRIEPSNRPITSHTKSLRELALVSELTIESTINPSSSLNMLISGFPMPFQVTKDDLAEWEELDSFENGNNKSHNDTDTVNTNTTVKTEPFTELESNTDADADAEADAGADAEPDTNSPTILNPNSTYNRKKVKKGRRLDHFKPAKKRPKSVNNNNNSTTSSNTNGGNESWRTQLFQSIRSPNTPSGTKLGPGYTVTDHWWWLPLPEINPLRTAQPFTAAQIATLTQVSADDACRAHGLSLGRQMRIKLKDSTLIELQSAIRSERGEVDRTVLAMCSSGKVRKCAIYRADEHTYTVLATDNIQSGEPVCVVIGTLREKSSFTSRVGSPDSIAHLWSYRINKENGRILPMAYNGPDLIVETVRYGNEAHFLLDAAWNHRKLDANIQSRICWNEESGLPYIVFVAIRPIELGTELLVNWGESCSPFIWRSQLRALADYSHRLNYRLYQLQELCKLQSINYQLILDQIEIELQSINPNSIFDPAISWACSQIYSRAISDASKSETARLSRRLKIIKQRLRLEEIAATTTSTAVTVTNNNNTNSAFLSNDILSIAQSSLNEPTFHLLPTPDAAFLNASCRLIRECDWISGLTLEQHELVRIAFRKTSKGHHSMNLTDQCKRIIKTGEVPKARVHEIISLRHPARFYTSPEFPAFALVATSEIKCDEVIGCYLGIVRDSSYADLSLIGGTASQEKSAWEQVYMYGMEPEEISAKYTGNKLLIDGLIAGNETRFMNDSYSRLDSRGSRNVESTVLWDVSREQPVMCIASTRAIHKGEELIVDYGNQFWRQVTRGMCQQQAEYIDRTRIYIQRLRSALDSIAGLIINPPLKHIPHTFNHSAVYYPAEKIKREKFNYMQNNNNSSSNSGSSINPI